MHRSGAGLGALRIVVAVDFLVFGLTFPILPLYARHLGLPVVAVGALVATYSLAQLLAAPAWGRVSDRLGRRSALLASLAGSAASSLLIALAPAGSFLFVAVAVNGASGGSIAVAQASVVDVVPPADQSRALGLLGAGIAAGFVLGPGLAGLAALGGARLPFVLAAVLAAANAAYGTRHLPETRPAAASGSAASDPLRSTVPSGRVARAELLGVVGLAAGAFGIFEATFALVGRRHFGFGESGAGLCFALVGLSMAFAQARGVGPLARRLGPARTALAGGVAFAVGLVCVALWASWWTLAVGLALVGAGNGVISPVVVPALARSAPAAGRGALLGRQQAVVSSARILGPLLGGIVLAGSGTLATYALAAAVVLAALGLVGSRRARALLGATSAALAPLAR